MADFSPDAPDPAATALLVRIETYGFNAPDDPLAFESRLADDQGWTLGHAVDVAAEYRRFLVLTQVAGRPVSPSPDVDEAWHLHLTRTAHYEAFCAALFGRFLHHEPARAGEGERHRDMYRDTLAAYRRAFGAGAPTAIWPLPGRPAAPQADAALRWTIPEPLRRRHRLAQATVLGAIAAALLLRGAGLLEPLQQVGPAAFLLCALLATVAAGWRGLGAGAPSREQAARDRLEPYEVAWLRGGAPRMAMTAIVALTDRGVLLKPGAAPERGPRPAIPVDRSVEARPAHPAEAACLSAATDEGLRFTAACHALRPLAGQVERRLVAAGLATDDATLPLRRARALLGLALLLVIEFERLFHAFGTRQRIGFLALLTLAGVALAFVLAQRLRRANARSTRVLDTLRATAAPATSASSSAAPRVGQALAFGVALAGTAAFASDLRFEGLRQQVHVPSLDAAARRANSGSGSGCSSGSSCGSGDGGSGGGSSCGSSCGGGCGGGGD